jgi:purine-binding chemotaxis protein CheW
MNNSNRYLCFNLAAEEFAIPLISVREVIGVPEVTPIPQSPSYFLGIMNLRGQIISVLDLRTKYGIKSARTEETAVIILDFVDYHLGVMVDQVNSVVELSEADISERPQMETSKISESIKGVFRKQDRLILLIDVFKTLSIEDQNTFKKEKKVS